MATYYKYQNPSEIGAAPTLDWGTVISNVNETLQRQEQQRYENREADKKITNDILTKVNELNLTNDPNANALITNMAYEAKQNLGELNKKLQRGEISRSDFNILNQNTMGSIAQLNQFSKTYGADYDTYMKNLQEGKTSAYADFMQKWKGGFQNFKYKKLVHNPSDGRLYIAELDDKGNVKEGPLGLVPMSVLTEVKNFDDKKVDVLAETNRYAGQMKPFVDLIRSGKIESIEALSNMPNFQDFVNNVTEAIAKNEKGYASILTDTDGTYSITGLDQSVGKNIGLKNNGAGEMVPIIDENMKNRARGIIQEYLIAQTGIKEVGREEFAPQRPTGEGTKKEKEKPIFGEVKYINRTSPTGKKYSTGVSQSLGNITFSGGKGIEHVPKKIGYEDGRLWLQGYTITGKESTEGFGMEPSTTVIKKDDWGNITGYKTDTKTGEKIPIKTNFIDDKTNADTVSMYVQQIQNPSTGENFTSLEEAKQYYKGLYEQETKGKPATAKTQQGNIVSYISNGKQYNIPKDQESEFLKDNPKAKKI